VSAPGLKFDAVVRRGTFELRLALSVAPGEVLGVLGPNGSGKSTLLRALAGLTPISDGRISVDGADLDRPDGNVFVPPEERRVGLVFQSYRLFPHLTVRDNVAFAPRSQGASRQRSRALAQPWLEQLDLLPLADRRPAELSGGQAQRVALARALAVGPALLLLDEPLAALDAQTRLEMRSQLRRYIAGFGGPVLLVTHDPLEAMVMADRLVVIEQGRIVQDGTPAQVARRPATQYVARLMGLNLYAGEIRRSGEVSSVELEDGGTLVVPTESEPSSLGDGTRVLVGLRPSSITVHLQRPERASTRNVWPGTVAGLEMLADRVRLQVDGRPSALVDVTPAAMAELGLRPGVPVWLSAKATETDAYAYAYAYAVNLPGAGAVDLPSGPASPTVEGADPAAGG
jgi:molybdate transport system ATP-binding protein